MIYEDLVSERLFDPGRPRRVDEPQALPRIPADPLDLTARDVDIVNTEKVGPLDEVLLQPPQDPDWRPPAVTS